MKISLGLIECCRQKYNWSDLTAPDGLDDLVEKIGAQLGAVEEVIDIGKKYDGVVLVKVVECVQHPNADRLKVCHIDDGGRTPDVNRLENGLVEVVCGAPNVAAGQTVAWLPPGSTVPETASKDPYVLTARELRGVMSNGMLASPKELALGDSHEGLLIIDGDYAPGTPFADAFGLTDDAVIDIENKMFTHRPDCFGVLGVARELAGIQQLAFKSPEWYVNPPEVPTVNGEELPVTITNEVPELVPRFTAIVMKDVQVKTSPAWLQIELAKVGLRPINNIVDLTNFYMLLTGQPLHAYDYDKVKALSAYGNAAIIVRHPKQGETLQLLNGKEVEPRKEAVMIATDQKLIGIGGVMGGAETEVDSTTQNIIIECANFDMYSVRRTSMAHGLFTDAVTRFNKGQSPLQTVAVLLKMVADVQRLADGDVASGIIDDIHLPAAVLDRQSNNEPVHVTAAFINARLGLSLDLAAIRKLLENVEFKVDQDNDELVITAPFWRTDIALPEDIVEEVGRLYGYDKLPLELPKRYAAPAKKDSLLEAKAAIRRRLAAAGAQEVLTYSFVHGDMLQKAGQDPGKAYKITNALSPDLQYYRLSLMPSLLDKIHANIKSGYDEFVLFELGKTHSTDHTDQDGLPEEFEFTGLVVAASDKLKRREAAYYQAKQYLETLAGGAKLVYRPLDDQMAAYPVAKPYQTGRAATVWVQDGPFIGIIGEFTANVRSKFKLPRFTAGFELDTKVLAQLTSAQRNYQALSKYPSVKQDISLRLGADVPYHELAACLNAAVAKNLPDASYFNLEAVDIFQPDNTQDRKHITLRLTIASYQRTLTDAEVNALLDAAASEAANSFSAERI